MKIVYSRALVAEPGPEAAKLHQQQQLQLYLDFWQQPLGLQAHSLRPNRPYSRQLCFSILVFMFFLLKWLLYYSLKLSEILIVKVLGAKSILCNSVVLAFINSFGSRNMLLVILLSTVFETMFRNRCGLKNYILATSSTYECKEHHHG